MKLLLTGAFKYTDEQIEYLKSLGNDIVYVQDERKKIDFDVSDIEGVVCNGLQALVLTEYPLIILMSMR